MPLVSVIIPIYNTEKFLPLCINSVLNQTLTDIEVLLVNDGSTDGRRVRHADGYLQKGR
jgi:glycosyltransferase EpsH